MTTTADIPKPINVFREVSFSAVEPSAGRKGSVATCKTAVAIAPIASSEIYRTEDEHHSISLFKEEDQTLIIGFHYRSFLPKNVDGVIFNGSIWVILDWGRWNRRSQFVQVLFNPTQSLTSFHELGVQNASEWVIHSFGGRAHEWHIK
jgi:hypothetical protein